MKRYLCAVAGCFATVDAPGRFCAAHASLQAERDAIKAKRDAGRWERGGGAAWRWVYRDSRWRRARREQLARQPRCCRCGAPATDVDHIIPHQGREEYAFNLDNLQSMCHACHMAKTRADRGRRPIAPSEKIEA
ncbi:MAG TPA: HNH endonuclease signature motif containing protein [Spirochaetia bacterium]|nr:HNH endonuclease signature motif containing protein [Spirochaetia bacterium]